MRRLPLIIITGLSGSGKSTAVAALEDVGFFCVDNMPVELLPKFVELPLQSDEGLPGAAFVMDLREKGFVARYEAVLGGLRAKGFRVDILFLEADEAVLVQRFSATRRQHPLARGRGLAEGIREEAQLLQPLRAAADHVTEKIRGHRPLTPMQVHVLSFGFKYGPALEADLLLDVRFLLNPHFVPELKPLDGEQPAIRRFVLENPEAQALIAKYTELIDYLLPRYEREGKSHLTIAVGCTGGRHRSVAVARALYDHIAARRPQVDLIHRDIRQPH
ncbi:MAG: RNase adapter RapZ [Desulfobacterales bacterium]|nr:RNase adapter RapZ [Desulfobacterales bacterium]